MKELIRELVPLSLFVSAGIVAIAYLGFTGWITKPPAARADTMANCPECSPSSLARCNGSLSAGPTLILNGMACEGTFDEVCGSGNSTYCQFAYSMYILDAASGNQVAQSMTYNDTEQCAHNGKHVELDWTRPTLQANHNYTCTFSVTCSAGTFTAKQGFVGP